MKVLVNLLYFVLICELAIGTCSIGVLLLLDSSDNTTITLYWTIIQAVLITCTADYFSPSKYERKGDPR